MTKTQAYIMEHPREAQRLLDKVDAPAWIAKFIEPHLSRVRSFLSVGCGPAVLLRELAERHPGIEIVGVDLSASRVRAAEERLRGLPNAHACVGNAQSLPFESDSFDLVFSRFLLEYLPDKPRAVQEMARICTPEGKLLLQDLDGQLGGIPRRMRSYRPTPSEFLATLQAPVSTRLWVEIVQPVLECRAHRRQRTGGSISSLCRPH